MESVCIVCSGKKPSLTSVRWDKCRETTLYFMFGCMNICGTARSRGQTIFQIPKSLGSTTKQKRQGNKNKELSCRRIHHLIQSEQHHVVYKIITMATLSSNLKRAPNRQDRHNIGLNQPLFGRNHIGTRNRILGFFLVSVQSYAKWLMYGLCFQMTYTFKGAPLKHCWEKCLLGVVLETAKKLFRGYIWTTCCSLFLVCVGFYNAMQQCSAHALTALFQREGLFCLISETHRSKPQSSAFSIQFIYLFLGQDSR